MRVASITRLRWPQTCIAATIDRMLLELVVENYAVVERLRVHFHAGLNLLTGETGSGKSIVVDALGLLLGSRASAEMIRTGAARARVAGIFEVRDQGALRQAAGAGGPRDRGGRAADRTRDSGAAENRGPSWAAVRSPWRCCGTWRRSWAIFTDNTISSFCFRRMRSATCWTRSRQIASCWIARRGLYRRVARGGGGVGRAGAQRAGEAAPAGPVELPAQGDRRRGVGGRTRIPRSRTSGACCRTCRSCRRAPGRRTMRSSKARNRRCRWRGSRPSGWTSCAASIPRSEALREHLKSAEISLQEVAYTLRDYLGRAGGESGAAGGGGDAAGGD